MINTHHIYLVSDSTGETIDRIFMALKAQFQNFKYKVHHFSFTRTENQISKILENKNKNENIIILGLGLIWILISIIGLIFNK